MGERNETLASEMYGDLKKELKVKNWLIFLLVAVLEQFSKLLILDLLRK